MILERLARLADRRGKGVVIAAIVFFAAAGALGAGVADRLDPYGADDPATESVKADERLEMAGHRATSVVALVDGIDVDSAAGRQRVKELTREISRDEDVAGIAGFYSSGSRDFVSRDGRSTYLSVSLGPTEDDELQDAGERIAAALEGEPDVTVGGSAVANQQVNEQVENDLRRAELYAFPILFLLSLLGSTAAFVDLQDSLVEHLPLVLAIVAAVTIVVLFLMTGSVVLPFKQVLMNVLGLSAVFGILVLVFQDGRFEGLLGYTSQGALESTQPLLLFAVAFGLSTDYGVFLLSRIKEARDRGASDAESVAIGLERTGRIVTAAAALFCIAIGAFVTSEMIFIKQLGLGTALAVLIDATIIRALLVPSLMRMLGRWNWWAPAPMRRLQARVGLGEA